MSSTIQILIADDEDKMRRLVGDFLKREGYTVLEAKDGGQAVDIVDEKGEEISLVVLDVMMPVQDGWSVLRHIKSKHPNLPVIMLTARTEEADEIFGLELGADDYVGKPFSPIVLTARIKSLLRKSAEVGSTLPKTYGALTIDDVGRIVTLNGKRLDLSPKEYEPCGATTTSATCARWTPTSKKCAPSWATGAASSTPCAATATALSSTERMTTPDARAASPGGGWMISGHSMPCGAAAACPAGKGCTL